jgi:serine/threonine protein kinase
MAPELFQEEGDGAVYDAKVDVYSFSIMMYEIIFGMRPFCEANTYRHFARVIQGSRPLVPNSAAPWLRQLLDDCWSSMPEQRPEFSVIFDTLLRVNFMVAEGVDPAKVFRFLEWAAGRA